MNNIENPIIIKFFFCLPKIRRATELALNFTRSLVKYLIKWFVQTNSK